MKAQYTYIVQTALLFLYLILVVSCGNQPSRKEADSAKDIVEVDSMKSIELELDIDTIFELDFSGQGLTEVPDLSDYPHLKKLDLSHNKITLSTFEEFTRLTFHNIGKGHYESSQLEYLDLSHNQIGRLDYPFKLSYFQSLEILDLSHNTIERFWPNGVGQAMSKLDLSHNSLEFVSINIPVDTLDLSFNERLKGRQRVVKDLISQISMNGIDSSRIHFNNNILHEIRTGGYEFDTLSDEQADSLKRVRHYQRILTEQLEIEDPNTKYPIALLEEMSYYENGYHRTLDQGRVLHSSDNNLTIYQFEGETVGAYSNPFYITIVRTWNPSTQSDVNVGRIDTVHVMPDGKYLILHDNWGRPASVYSENTLSASLLSFNKDGMHSHPIQTPKYPWHTKKEDREQLMLIMGGGTSNGVNMELSYDSNNQILSYQFSNNLYWCCRVDSTYTYSGTYSYIDSEFVHQLENREGRIGKKENN